MQRNHLPPSSSVPFGDEVLNVGIQLVICVDVYVLEQSGVGVSWGRKTGWGGVGLGPNSILLSLAQLSVSHSCPSSKSQLSFVISHCACPGKYENFFTRFSGSNLHPSN